MHTPHTHTHTHRTYTHRTHTHNKYVGLPSPLRWSLCLSTNSEARNYNFDKRQISLDHGHGLSACRPTNGLNNEDFPWRVSAEPHSLRIKTWVSKGHVRSHIHYYTSTMVESQHGECMADENDGTFFQWEDNNNELNCVRLWASLKSLSMWAWFELWQGNRQHWNREHFK